MTGIAITLVLIATIAGAGVALWVLRARRGIWAVTCDLRRCLVIIGPEQNDEACVAQRRALKPLLMRIRHLGMNVIELYGSMTPRRNGRPLEWLDNGMLRRALKARTGFALICLDDESEIILRSSRPVSENSLSELISMGEPIALPSPSETTARPAPEHGDMPRRPAPVANGAEPVTSWGRVGVLR